MQSTEANCFPESFQQRPCLYNAKWSSFSRPVGRTTGPHHCGYSSNVQFSRPTRTSRPTSTATEPGPWHAWPHDTRHPLQESHKPTTADRTPTSA
ncbi:hypothetical protein AMECASPLE_032587 [Ameca splendens]|uniref:Uncharacterized protein n=1 Tax=Ameca splendens TaxID=208324 RepID=A0ABV0Y6N8_9TELE